MAATVLCCAAGWAVGWCVYHGVLLTSRAFISAISLVSSTLHYTLARMHTTHTHTRAHSLKRAHTRIASTHTRQRRFPQYHAIAEDDDDYDDDDNNDMNDDVVMSAMM